MAAARPFLAGAEDSPAAVEEAIRAFEEEIRTACFLTASPTVADLRGATLRRIGPGATR